MAKNFLTVHTLVKNEARWIWFALQSVLPFVDEILVWDTGSTDGTDVIVQKINHPKIKFKNLGPVDALGHTQARQAMIKATDSNWILILDGDEVWWSFALNKLIQAAIANPNTSAFISPFINCVGDVFHLQDPSASLYQIGDYQGAYNLRLINARLPGLHVANPHGRQEYRTANEIALQYLPYPKLQLVDWPYLHLTHLPRSLNRNNDVLTLKRDFKYRYELGLRLPPGFVFPDSFYLPRPKHVPDPFFHRSKLYVFKSLVFEPVRKIKQSFIKQQKNGY